MLVALAIMALMLGIVMPFVRATPGVTLEQAAQRIVGNLIQARNAAMRSSHVVVFTIDTASGRFGHEHLERLAESHPPIALSLYTTSDQRRGAAEGTIRFFPDGGSTGGGVTLVQGAQRIRILVDWLTGQVSLLRSDDRPADAR